MKGVILRARWETEVHEVGDVRLPLAAVEGPHGELLGLLVHEHASPTNKGNTDGLGDCILIRLPKALRALVLPPRLLAVARGRRGP